MDLITIRDKALAGADVWREEALFLAQYPDLHALCDAADQISRKFAGSEADTCSIINARSGMCGEDCKWCAQATRFRTGCETYNFIDEEEAVACAKENERHGVKRFSLVTSGRALSDADLDVYCRIAKRLSRETNLYLCASMGLLTEPQMRRLAAAGIRRYHCNMETSERYFPRLCTTHTPADKRQTIAAARRAGLDICSGGIIGMGETMEDRIDLALELREIGIDSMPINILIPVKGTPLESTPLISEEEVIRSVAIFRFLLPRKSLRFAGGRKRLSQKTMLRILRGGLNGLMIGDMLTSIGNNVADDRKLFAAAELKF